MANSLPLFFDVFSRDRSHSVAAQPRTVRPGTQPIPKLLTAGLLALATLSASLAHAQTGEDLPDAPPPALVAGVKGGSLALPLLTERLTVRIDGGHAETTLSQVFQNETKDSLEGTYALSLGAEGSATGFSYWNGKSRILGEIFEKEAAARVYTEVSGLGRDPGLLEHTGEGRFSFRVAPITPGEKKRVDVSYSQWLEQRGTVREYRAPISLAGATGSIWIAGDESGRVESPTHQISVASEAGGRRIKLISAKTTGPLRLRIHSNEKPLSLSTHYHQDPGQDAYLLLTVPAPSGDATSPEPRDVTLVLDRSGSMSGDPLTAAKKAAEGIISRLNPKDHVNVVVFDDGAQSLFERPENVGAHRAEALNFVRAITDGGGTDLGLALSESLKKQTIDARADYIVFLTDGQSDAPAALKAASGAPASVRLYTVGLGSGVDRPLLSRIARNHRGKFTYVAESSQIEARVGQLYSNIQTPVLTDLKLSVDGARTRDLYPRTLPDLFVGDEFKLALRAAGRPGKTKATITLTAKRAGKPISLKKTIALTPKKKAWVGRLWAQERLGDLEEQMSLTGETEELKTETVELALAYSVLTRFTSFLAIPESELTANAKATMAEERKRRRDILAAHKDAAALSRQLMPPGDPVLTVKAPRDAKAVTAFFPFGLTLDLAFDDKKDMWSGRFLVPSHVTDASYRVDILILNKNGLTEASSIDYEIDSRSPAFEVSFTRDAGKVSFLVEGDEELSEVRLVLRNPSAQRKNVLVHLNGPCGPDGCSLKRNDARTFAAELRLPEGVHDLFVIASDRAGNETRRALRLRVTDDGAEEIH